MAAPIYYGGRQFSHHGKRFRHNVIIPFIGSGAPVNAVTGAGVAGTGSLYIDYVAGAYYVNVGTKTSPTWTQLDSAAGLALTNGHIFVGSAGNLPADVAMSGDATIANTGAVTVNGLAGTPLTVTPAELNFLHSKNPALGLGASYKLARGVHQQAAATDTVVTGLATVVAVVASFRDTPTLKQMFVYATIGDQAGTPAAGSFNISTKKPTANNDVTPIAATDFTDNINFNWIAIGT